MSLNLGGAVDATERRVFTSTINYDDDQQLNAGCFGAFGRQQAR